MTKIIYYMRFFIIICCSGPIHSGIPKLCERRDYSQFCISLVALLLKLLRESI